MKKNIKILMIAICLLVLLSCATFSIVNVKHNVNGEEIALSVAVIKQGSRGETVRQIQQKLKRWGYYSGSVDGIFGPQTYKAVRYFQQKNKLQVDGIVGPKTLGALGISSSTAGTSSSNNTSFSNSDIQLLARLIYGEARGESYTGQIAVGAVVMNRLRSSSFPNTISGVIYQPYAFTAVDDGQINLTPNDKAYRAAKEAMNGYDPSYGALYYYNPATATSSWIFSRKTTVVIGRHVFAI